MAGYKVLVFLLLVILGACFVSSGEFYNERFPRVVVAVLARNKANIIPYFLTSFQNLIYPKNRIDLWIRSENNYDETDEVVKKWAEKNNHLYNSFRLQSIVAPEPRDDSDPDTIEVKVFWNVQQHKHIAKLRQEALDYARDIQADYIFMVDADVVLTEPATLNILVGRKYPIVAPMLLSDGTHSNFWAGESKDFPIDNSSYYMRFYKRELPYLGCHNVPAVHTAVLTSLKSETSKELSYYPAENSNHTYLGDDVSTFAASAKRLGFKIKLCNDQLFGFTTLPNTDNDPIQEAQRFVNLKVDALGHEVEFPLDPELAKYVTYPKPSSFGCDMIYLINLDRRPIRKKLMLKTFKELGIEVKRLPAVDGLELNRTGLRRLNVRMMPTYEDPYHGRPMKGGEVGCFLSHYNIWKKIVKKNYRLTMVLEDDARFAPNFREIYHEMLAEVKELDFDLIYLGRKILMNAAEEQVTPHTTRPRYSYWTVGYLLTNRGARKLLDAKPLKKIVPVDEFLPIMFDQHPNETWKSYFPKRNLIALSAKPLLVQPTLYTGMPGYVSDTELSSVINTRTFYLRKDL